MTSVSNEQQVHNKIDLPGLDCFVCGTADAVRPIKLEYKGISSEVYEGFKFQMMPEQVAGVEYAASKDLTQKPKDITERRSKLYIPRLEWLTKTHPVLTNQVRTLLETLWTIVVSRAAQFHFPIERTVVSIFTDPTERESKAVLRLTCHATISQALAFWDSLEYDLRDWLNNLTEHQRTIFITKISLRVYWL